MKKYYLCIGALIIAILTAFIIIGKKGYANEINILTKDEIIDYFHENEEYFSEIQKLSTTVTPDYVIVFHRDTEQNKIKAYDNGADIDIEESECFSQLSENFIKCNLRELHIYDRYFQVYIISQSSSNVEQGIYYSELGMTNMGSSEDEKIKDNWYYYQIAYT